MPLLTSLLGIPWWSSGWDSALSLPRAWAGSLVEGLRSASCHPCSFTKRLSLVHAVEIILSNLTFVLRVTIQLRCRVSIFLALGAGRRSPYIGFSIGSILSRPHPITYKNIFHCFLLVLSFTSLWSSMQLLVSFSFQRKTVWHKLPPGKVIVSVAQLCPTLRPHGLQHSRPPCPSNAENKWLFPLSIVFNAGQLQSSGFRILVLPTATPSYVWHHHFYIYASLSLGT